MWGISSWLLQQSTAAAPYMDKGYLLIASPPDLEHGVAPLGPLAPMQRLLLGHGVAPPGCQSPGVSERLTWEYSMQALRSGQG